MSFTSDEVVEFYKQFENEMNNPMDDKLANKDKILQILKSPNTSILGVRQTHMTMTSHAPFGGAPIVQSTGRCKITIELTYMPGEVATSKSKEKDIFEGETPKAAALDVCCKKCGHNGEWLTLALVCPEHGKIAGV